MYLVKRKQFDWTFVLGACDGAAMVLATALGAGCLGPEPGAVPLGALALYVILFFVFLHRSSLYGWRCFTSVGFCPLGTGVVFLKAGLSFLAVAALMGFDPRLFLSWLAAETGLGFLLLWGGRFLARKAMMDWFRAIPQEMIVFVGWSPALEKLIAAYRQDVGRFQTVLGFIEIPGRPVDPALAEQGIQNLGSIDAFEEIASKAGATLLLVDEAAVSSEQLHAMAMACSLWGVHLLLLPASIQSLTRRIEVRRVGEMSLIGAQGVSLDLFFNRFLKRTVDIAGALVGLAISGPVILALAFLIKRESPGPAFFTQPRVGRDGRPFSIYKLRSMRLGADAGPYQATVANDARILKVGKFIRRTNLDETPQFYNVLKGDMSLVGPRPEVIFTMDQLKRNIRHYNLRHHCKPGLTGWAAVNGFRGGKDLFPERLEYDLEYYENWSLAFDFYIMLRTLLPPKNAH
jgi:exopolysaccharide biosynthesis polyprenyl glycosylphosphotransferase